MLRLVLALAASGVDILKAAAFFSRMGAFDVGYQEVNAGPWLNEKMLTRRECDLTAVGWNASRVLPALLPPEDAVRVPRRQDR